MNNVKKKFSSKLTITTTLFAVSLLLTLSACLKKNDDDFVPQQVAAVSIFHASPGTPAFDFAANGRFVNGPFQFGQRTFYSLFNIGNRPIGIYKTNTTDSIRTGTINLEKDKYYSLYVVDADPNPNFLLVKDSVAAPAATKARIRFINLSPDAGELSVTTQTDSLLFDATAYKEVTAFNEIPGNKIYSFSIKSNGTTKATEENFEIKTGRIYTIWSRGLESSTNDTLKLDVKVSEHLNNF